MSTDGHPVPCRGLGDYITELVTRLAAAEPAAFRELRAVVGSRRARISLDGETVVVGFEDDLLHVDRPTAAAVDGEGATEGDCVLDLLDGYLEVSEAVLDDRLRVRGGFDDVASMFAAIEIILDVSARSPALQWLARDLRADPWRPARPPRLPGDVQLDTHWRAGTVTDEEARLLARLDVLPDGGGDG